MFKIGDNICYFESRGKNEKPFRGMVLEIKDKIRISYFDAAEQKILWVDPEQLTKQNTSRCANNEECGLCDDTGKCFYEKEI